MKKNYIYWLILILVTIVLTLFFSSLYRKEAMEFSYLYENLNKITATEFEEYMIEHPDAIIYIGDKNDLSNNKLEKNWIKKLERLNLLETAVYIEKKEMNKELQKKLKDQYSYNYNESSLPIIIVINDGEVIQTSIINENSAADSIIDYEVFE